MNTSRVVCWGRWGQWSRTDAARAGAVPHGATLLGTLWACRQLVPTAPTVPTPATPKIKLVGRDWQTTNYSTYWS